MVDELDLDSKLEAFTRVESMFESEMGKMLEEVGESKGRQVKYLSQTMRGMIKNIVEEVNNNREQMLRILEQVGHEMSGKKLN